MNKELHSIRKKIVNLLNRTIENGATKNEAEVCLIKANKLMTEYNIKENELGLASDTEKVFKVLNLKRNSRPVIETISLLAEFGDCMMLSSKIDHTRKRDYVIFGTEHDTEIVLYLISIVLNCIETEISEFKRVYKLLNKPRSKLRFAIKSFLFGISDGIQYKIETLKKEKEKDIKLSTGTNLIELKRNNLITELEEIFPQINFKNFNAEHEVSDTYYRQGLEKGKQIEFYDALENEGEEDGKDEIEIQGNNPLLL